MLKMKFQMYVSKSSLNKISVIFRSAGKSSDPLDILMTCRKVE